MRLDHTQNYQVAKQMVLPEEHLMGYLEKRVREMEEERGVLVTVGYTPWY